MAAKKNPPQAKRRKAPRNAAGLPRHRTAPRFAGAQLRDEVRAFCEKEYERVTYEKWDPQAYPDWSTLEQIYERRREVARNWSRVRELLDELTELETRRDEAELEEWPARGDDDLRRSFAPLTEWLDTTIPRLARLAPDVPPTVLGFAVQLVSGTPIPSEVPEDRRLRVARRAPPDVYWRSGPGRFREPTSRELAFMTLLLGHWPDLQLGGPGHPPEEVVRQEARAIQSARRRRR